MSVTSGSLAASTSAAPQDSPRLGGYPWPSPANAGFTLERQASETPGCHVLGVNGKRMEGQLAYFAPAEQVAHIFVTQMRKTVSLRFDQFRTLAMAAPFSVPVHNGVRTSPPRSKFRVNWNDGDVLAGDTFGHVESPFGLFLFVPGSPDAVFVTLLFIPSQSYRLFEANVTDDPSPRSAGGTATPAELTRASVTPGPSGGEVPDLMSQDEVVTPQQLLARLDSQARMPIIRIGQALTSLRMITDAQLREALETQQLDRSVPLGETLVRMGVVTRTDLQIALARKMGYPLVDLTAFPAAADALRKINYSVAQRLQVMPLLIHDGRLIIALDDPVSRHSAIEEVEFIAQMKVVAVLGQCRDLSGLLYSLYDKIGATKDGRPNNADPSRPIEYELTGTNELLETLEKEGLQQTDEDVPIEQSDNSLVRLINRMILEAHKGGVSDIHIESYPGREKIRIRFRKDGRLSTYLELPPNYRNAMIARLKIMCDLDISEKRKPQDGKINFAKFSPQHKLELRVATIPTNSGLEDVVMRLLASAKPIPLDRLGLSGHNLVQLKTAIERPYGMVLCVGPTGSGKTTTLHSALMHINVPERKIWTAEDPIEITQAGLRQVQVNPRIDWTFAKALRAFLRADPDVVMVGEIRDEETAKTAIEASLTGHLVLSTLHTNSAPETVTRLLDMGMDPFNFADSLLAVMAQRLVRRLCASCVARSPASPDEVDELLADYMHVFNPENPPVSKEDVRSDWLQRHGQDGRIMKFRPVGCKQCDDSGYKGRVGIHELMVVSREMRRLIQGGARAEELQELALRQGMRTLRQDGIDKIVAGHTTMDEVRSTSNA